MDSAKFEALGTVDSQSLVYADKKESVRKHDYFTMTHTAATSPQGAKESQTELSGGVCVSKID